MRSRDALRFLRHSARALVIRHAPVGRGSPHTLPGHLVISLTSYPPRYPTLDLTLRGLLAQDVAPDALVLWIARNDVTSLPRRVLDLQRHGLQIRESDELRSIKKIVPAIKAYPGAFIVIADDDVHYPKGWLRRFTDEYRSGHEILCQRATRVTPDANGGLAPYLTWPHVNDDEPAGPDVMPVGVGGVMYPPGSLPPETTDASRFLSLCPTNDDLWLYWMLSKAGCVAKRIRSSGRDREWYGSQEAGLWPMHNRDGGTDRQLAALLAAFGIPHPSLMPSAL